MSLQVRPCLVGAILLASALMPLQAHAQTYSYKILSTPFLAHACFAERSAGQVLNDKGEVAGMCDFWTGYAFDQNGAGLPAVVSTYGKPKPYVWPATDAARALSLPAGQMINLPTIDNAGTVRSVAMDPVAGRFTSGNVLVWKGTQRTMWSTPTPDWSVSWISPNGQILGLGPDSLGIFGGAAPALVPLPPVEEVKDRNASWAVMNDAGQIAYYFDHIGPDLPDNGQLWSWRNGAWTRVLPVGTYPPYPQPYLLVNAVGTIMATNSAYVFDGIDLTWRDGVLTRLAAIPNYHRYTAMHPGSGDMVGWLRNTSSENRATLWRHGVAIDLNTKVKLPAGLVLKEAIDINQRGQILAKAGLQLVLLTPK